MTQVTDTMLKITDLSARVAGKEILKGINLEVKAGEVHAIMGPNGSGKSTLANVLCGNPGYQVTEGAIRLLGDDITRLAAFICGTPVALALAIWAIR